MTHAPAGQGSDPCPVCGHPEDAHVVWHADETFDGWAHCTIGTGDTACTCWREWPRLSDESDDPAFAEVVPETDDRPLAHDWRYVVRTFGKVLIATGLLLGGFVAYQLWGTGIEAARAQNELEDEFESLLAATVDDLGSHDDVDRGHAGVERTARHRVRHACPTRCRTTVPAPTTVPIAEGDPVARLEIPEIGLDVVVVAGVSVDDLRRGPGHYPDTPLPGQYGNAAIAGHRMTYGRPFQHIDDLDPGDEIVVTTLAGRFVYEVTGTEIVEPTDTDVVATTNPDIAELTLTSCHPKWSTRQRIIVHSLLIADESAPVTLRRRCDADHDRPPTTVSPTTTIASVTSTATTVPVTTSTIARCPSPTRRPDDPGTGRRRLLRRLVPRPLGDPPGRALGVGRGGHRHRRPRAAPARPAAGSSASPSASSRS